MGGGGHRAGRLGVGDRKSTRLNSSHANISYAVFCLKKKNFSHEAQSGHRWNARRPHPEPPLYGLEIISATVLVDIQGGVVAVGVLLLIVFFLMGADLDGSILPPPPPPDMS